MYEPRTYRNWVKAEDLVKFSVVEKETDLFILAEKDLSHEAKLSLHKYRTQIEDTIRRHPQFQTSFEPITIKRPNSAIIAEMLKASEIAGVGPMATVAGAIAEFVGKGLCKLSKEVIVENGGDIFLASNKPRTFGIFAGKSDLTGTLSFEIIPEHPFLGVCTSSGTVGHSISFGKADAAVIISEDAALADAVATACANRVKKSEDVETAIDFARSIPDVLAVMVIIGDTLASWGRKGFRWFLKS